MARPSIDVVVPFAGSPAGAAAVVARMASLRLRPGDTATLVLNTPMKAEPWAGTGAVQVVEASAVRSSYFARNAGAALGRAAWLLFLDADVRFDAGLLDRLFDPPPAGDVGVVAGGITDEVVVDTPVARALVRRRAMDQRNATAGRRPYAQTAHCAVRRQAFEEAGGFVTAFRSGADADLCLRLADRGWRLSERHDVAVRHEARATLRAVHAQLLRHGTGARWVARAHAGTGARRVRPGLLAWALWRVTVAGARRLRGDHDGALDALLDGTLTLAFESGRMLPSRAGRARGTLAPWRRSTSTG